MSKVTRLPYAPISGKLHTDIEKDIPIPDQRGINSSKWKTLHSTWEVGDSVCVDSESNRSSLMVYMKKQGTTTTSRMVLNEYGESTGQYRVWKTGEE